MLLRCVVLVCFSQICLSSFGHLPKIVDYRTHKIISDVRQQGNCGACWAFTPTELVETLRAMMGHGLQKLSVQHLMDCSGIDYDCSGGDVCDAITFLHTIQYHFVLERDYAAYDEVKHACRDTTHRSVNTTITKYWCESYSNREEELLTLIARRGPVISQVDSTAWKDYLGGIIQYNCESSHLNHAVVIVGYNLTNEIPYYIVKNTWGKSYGDHGYMYIKIGDNLCGIADRISHLSIT